MTVAAIKVNIILNAVGIRMGEWFNLARSCGECVDALYLLGPQATAILPPDCRSCVFIRAHGVDPLHQSASPLRRFFCHARIFSSGQVLRIFSGRAQARRAVAMPNGSLSKSLI